MSTAIAPSTVFLSRVRVEAGAFKNLDVTNADKHGVDVSYSEAVLVKADRGSNVATSEKFSNKLFPSIGYGDLNFYLARGYVELSQVKIEGSQEAVQALCGKLLDADDVVEAKQPDADMSVLFWGISVKVGDELAEELRKVSTQSIFGFSSRSGLINRTYLHGKAVFSQKDLKSLLPFFNKIESFGGSYAVYQHTFDRVAV